MKSYIAPCLALAAITPLAQAVTVGVDDSTAAWNGYMTVFNLDQTTYQFEGGWGVVDLTATFDDGAGTLTLSPNTIGDPNEYWYQNTSGAAADPVNPGGPGQLGNKHMVAALYIQADDLYAGDTVTFAGTVDSNTFTSAHTTEIFIRDFAPDYSSFNETAITATPGAFSIDLVADPGAGRHIQYGFRTSGENVWVTDTAPFGTVVIGTVPEPASLALLGMGGLALLGRRRG